MAKYAHAGALSYMIFFWLLLCCHTASLPSTAATFFCSQVEKMKQNEKFPKFGPGRDRVAARALCRRTPKQPFWQQSTDQLRKKERDLYHTYAEETKKLHGQKQAWQEVDRGARTRQCQTAGEGREL